MDAGLTNTGTFCYRNAALQLLSHSPLRLTLGRTALGCELVTLLHAMTRRRIVNPRKFNTFITKTTKFHGEDDAADFFAFIGIYINADICNINMIDVRVQTIAGILATVIPAQRLVTIYIYRRTGLGTVDLSRVNIPLQLDIGGEAYRLLGVICHRGHSADTGHYFTVIYNGSIWTRFDDDTVTVAASLVLSDSDCVTLVAYQPIVLRHHLVVI